MSFLFTFQDEKKMSICQSSMSLIVLCFKLTSFIHLIGPNAVTGSTGSPFNAQRSNTNARKTHLDLELDLHRPKSSCQNKICSADCPMACLYGCKNGLCVNCTKPGVKLPECKNKCDRGYFGKNCEQKCSTACKNSECDPVNGDCIECKAKGFSLPSCTVPCIAGTYGLHCERKCPLPCRESCDTRTGDCTLCRFGEGPQCKVNCALREEIYACRMYCPKRCLAWCNTTDGSCSTCSSGYLPPLCDKQCSSGFYGSGCKNKCPVRCRDQRCNPVNGVCHGCMDGYVGLKCRGQCIQGMYGEECAIPCPEVCIDKLCHFTDGRCMNCFPGYTGARCDQLCSNNTYGQRCRNSCSPYCQGECDAVTGECWRCQAGFQGLKCNGTCEEGVYGDNCGHPCPAGCLHRRCHHINGNCETCEKGFRGIFCDQLEEAKPMSLDTIIYIVLSISMPITFIGIGMISFKKCFSTSIPSASHRKRVDRYALSEKNSADDCTVSDQLNTCNIFEPNENATGLQTGSRNILLSNEDTSIHKKHVHETKPKTDNAQKERHHQSDVSPVFDSKLSSCCSSQLSLSQRFESPHAKFKQEEILPKAISSSAAKNPSILKQPGLISTSNIQVRSSLTEPNASVSTIKSVEDTLNETTIDLIKAGPYIQKRSHYVDVQSPGLARLVFKTWSETNFETQSHSGEEISFHSTPGNIMQHSPDPPKKGGQSNMSSTTLVMTQDRNQPLASSSKSNQYKSSCLHQCPVKNSKDSKESYTENLGKVISSKFKWQDDEEKHDDSESGTSHSKILTWSLESEASNKIQRPSKSKPTLQKMKATIHKPTERDEAIRYQHIIAETMSPSSRTTSDTLSTAHGVTFSLSDISIKEVKNSAALTNNDEIYGKSLKSGQSSNKTIDSIHRQENEISGTQDRHLRTKESAPSRDTLIVQSTQMGMQQSKEDDPVLASKIVRCTTTRQISPMIVFPNGNSVSPSYWPQLMPLPTPPPDGRSHLRHVRRNSPPSYADKN